MNKTLVRGFEAFFFVAISAFLSQIAIAGTPIDITKPESQARVVTAILASLGIAFRQYTASQTATQHGNTDGKTT